MKKIRLTDSNGVLQRQIDVNDATGNLAIYHSDDTWIMDIDAHGGRHKAGGIDPLPADSISNEMLQAGSVTSDKAAAKSRNRLAEVTTGVAIGVSGSPATIVSLSITSGYNDILPLTVKGDVSGLATGETATFAVVVELDDGSTATLVSASGITASTVFSIGDYDFTVIGDTRRIVKVKLTAESSATTTSATATGTISAKEMYI